MTERAPISLAVRARRLTTLARARSDDQKELQSQGQVETALRKLGGQLNDLESALKLHKHLQVAGVPVDDLPDLSKPAERLRDQVRTLGRPNAQFLNARSRDLEAARNWLTESDALAWQSWAGQQIQSLPLALMPRLGIARLATDQRVTLLRRLAAKPPKTSDVIEFRNTFSLVEDTLRGVDASDIDGVLGRFVNGRIRLADLSEDEVTMLRREPTLTDQIYVQLA